MPNSYLTDLLIKQAEAKSRYDTLTEILEAYNRGERIPQPATGFGMVIKDRRKEFGFTQTQLGEAVGYTGGSAVSISRVESETLTPPPDRIKKIAEVLDLDYTELLALSGQEEDQVID